jgi:hypothetical protein
MRFTRLLLALAISLWGTGTFLSSNALCGPKDGRGGREAAEPTGKNLKQEPDVKRSLRMEEVEIFGDVEKPKTMFVIPRSTLRYDRKDQEKDFTNEILGPITKEWVEDTQRWRATVPPP